MDRIRRIYFFRYDLVGVNFINISSLEFGRWAIYASILVAVSNFFIWVKISDFTLCLFMQASLPAERVNDALMMAIKIFLYLRSCHVN
jgi:hypothetical protein